MPRKARIKVHSKIYHIMNRGHRKSKVFYSDNDYKIYLGALKKYSKKFEIDVICYSLMPNHVHLLIHDKFDNKSIFMKYLNQKYAMYFNGRYNFVGPLFQDRFKCKGVENLNYLNTVFLYILTNCYSAGISQTFSYKWNSYNECIKNPSVINEAFWKNMFGNITTLNNEIERYEFRKQIIEDKPIENYMVQEYIERRFSITSINLLNNLPFDARLELAKFMNSINICKVKISSLCNIELVKLYKLLKDC